MFIRSYTLIRDFRIYFNPLCAAIVDISMSGKCLMMQAILPSKVPIGSFKNLGATELIIHVLFSVSAKYGGP